MKLPFALLLAVAATAAAAQGSAYRWTDKDGKVHYTDKAPLPDEAKTLEQRRIVPSVIDSGGKLPYAVKQAAQDFPVTIYLPSECAEACKVARGYLGKRGIPATEKIIATPEDAAAFNAATKSEMLPTLVVGNRIEKGFEESAWGNALDAAGYPPAQ